MEAIMNRYCVDVHQIIRFYIEAESEEHAETEVTEGESWYPQDHSGDMYEMYMEVEERD